MREHIAKLRVKFITLVFFLSIVISSVTIGLTGWIFYNNIMDYLQNKAIDIQYSNLTQLARRADTNFSKVENIARIIMHNSALKRALSDYTAYNENIYERGVVKLLIRDLLQGIKTSDSDIESITLIGTEGAFSMGHDIPLEIRATDVMNTNMGTDILKNKDKPLFIYLDQGLLTDKTSIFNAGSIYFGGSVQAGEKILGFVFIRVSNQWMNRMLNKNDKCAIVKSTSIIWKGADIDSKLISSSIERIDNKDNGIIDIPSSRKGRIFFKRLSTDEIYLLLEEDIRDTANRLKSVRYYMLYSLVLSFLISILLSRLLVGKMVKPFYKLIQDINSYKNDAGSQREDRTYKKGSLSMRERIMFHLILSVGVPIILFVMFYYISSSSIIKEGIISSNQNVFNQSAENISIFFERKFELFRTVGQDYTIQGLLAEGVNMNNNPEYKRIINSYFSLRNSFENLSLYDRDKKLAYSTFNGNGSIDLELLASQNNLKTGVNWVGFTMDEYNQPAYVLVYVISGVNLPPAYSHLNLKTIGYIVSYTNESQIEWLYRDVYTTYSADIFISDVSGNIVSDISINRLGTNINSFLQGLASQTKNLVFEREIPGTPLKLYGVYNMNNIVSGMKEVLYSKLYLIVIILLLLVLLSYEIAYMLMKPISKANYLVSKFKLFDVLEIFPESSRIVEIEELGNAFNEMKQRTDKLLDDLIVAKIKEDRLEIAKKEAEVRSLLSQIRPHFLCNTLESVRCLVKAHRIEEATKMLKNLGDLFRYGMSKQETLITVEEEFAYAKAYANIMSIRFGDKVNFVWNIDPRILKSLTLKMILQPLIENAIEHGIVPKGSKGNIGISCAKDKNNLTFVVKDDGVGMDAIPRTELNIDQADAKDGTNKIGLKNVMQRLALYYGEEGELNISSSIGNGTEIVIRLPDGRQTL